MFRLHQSRAWRTAPLREAVRACRTRLATGGIAASLAASWLLLNAAPAQAEIPIVGEIPVVGSFVKEVETAGEAVWNPAEALLKAFIHLLQAIFGGIEARLITDVIAGLLSIPNFDTGHVATLEQTTTVIAAGMLSAVLTLSILRYYIAGLADSGSGGFDALQGLVRVLGAIGLLVLWPTIFSEIVEIPSAFNHALLGSASVQHNVAILFDAALAIGSGAFVLSAGIGLIFVILIGLISAVVFIALLWMKVLLSVMMMFLYVSMPLCIVLWPIPELSWLASSAMKALAVAVVVPSVWAILFSLSAAVNVDVLTLSGSHSLIDTVFIRPLAGITLMLLCISIPRFLMRTAMIGPQGQPSGRSVFRTVTFGMFAARAAAGGARGVAAAAVEGQSRAARMIDSLPTQMKPPSAPGEGSFSARMVFGRSGFVKDGEGQGEKVPKPKGSEKEPAGQDGGSTPDPKVQAAEARQARTQAGADGAKQALGRQEAAFAASGIERPPFDRAVVDGAWQSMQSASRMAPPTAKQVAGAMGQFPEQTQRDLAAFHAEHPGRVRQFAAQHVASASLSAAQRDALLTIGSAPKDPLKSGMSQSIKALDAAAEAQTGGTPAQQAPVAPASGGAGSRTQGSAAPASSPPPQPASGAGTQGAAGPAGSPPSQPSSGSGTQGGAAPAGSPRGADGDAPPEGSRSLGADLREQPPTPDGGGTAGAVEDGLIDLGPFIE